MNNKVSYTHQYLSRTETFKKKVEDFSAGQKKKSIDSKKPLRATASVCMGRTSQLC